MCNLANTSGVYDDILFGDICRPTYRRDRRVREDPEVLVVLMVLAVLPDLYLRQVPEDQMVQVVLENRQVQVDLVDSRAVRHYQEVQKGPMVLESQVVPEVLVVPADRMAQLDRYFQANQQDLGFQVRQEFHCRLAGLRRIKIGNRNRSICNRKIRKNFVQPFHD